MGYRFLRGPRDFIAYVGMLFFLVSCSEEAGTQPEAPPEPWGYWEEMDIDVGTFRVCEMKVDPAGGAWALVIDKNASDQHILRYAAGAWRAAAEFNPLPFGLNNFYPLAADDMWAVNLIGECYRWRGGTWEMKYRAADELWDIWMVSPDEGWAVGAGGLVVHYKGGVFSEESLGGGTFYGVIFANPSDGWALGSYYDLFHWDGKNWATAGGPFAVSYVQPLGGGKCRAGGKRLSYAVNGLYDGAAWQYEMLPGTSAGGAVLFPNENEGWLVCSAHRSVTRGGQLVAKILHSRNGSWRVDDLTVECKTLGGLVETADGSVMCGGRALAGGGVILRYRPYGGSTGSS